MSANSWNTKVGLNHVGAYQVSGVPYASGSINCTGYDGKEITFPYVTRWVQVNNRGTFNLRVGFSQNGVTGSNYFIVAPKDDDANGAVGTSGVLEMKVSSLFISGSDLVDVVAGLTKINIASTTTDTGANWSGSSGVG